MCDDQEACRYLKRQVAATTSALSGQEESVLEQYTRDIPYHLLRHGGLYSLFVSGVLGAASDDLLVRITNRCKTDDLTGQVQVAQVLGLCGNERVLRVCMRLVDVQTQLMAMRFAVLAGDVATVAWMLDPNTCAASGLAWKVCTNAGDTTAYHAALATKNIQILRLLVEHTPVKHTTSRVMRDAAYSFFTEFREGYDVLLENRIGLDIDPQSATDCLLGRMICDGKRDDVLHVLDVAPPHKTRLVRDLFTLAGWSVDVDDLELFRRLFVRLQVATQTMLDTSSTPLIREQRLREVRTMRVDLAVAVAHRRSRDAFELLPLEAWFESDPFYLLHIARACMSFRLLCDPDCEMAIQCVRSYMRAAEHSPNSLEHLLKHIQFLTADDWSDYAPSQNQSDAAAQYAVFLVEVLANLRTPDFDEHRSDIVCMALKCLFATLLHWGKTDVLDKIVLEHGPGVIPRDVLFVMRFKLDAFWTLPSQRGLRWALDFGIDPNLVIDNECLTDRLTPTKASGFRKVVESMPPRKHRNIKSTNMTG